MRELEAILRVTLFERRAQGMELTKAGHEFLQVARDILEKVDAAHQIDRGTSDISGTLAVAATYTVIGYFLPYHLGRLAQLYPRIETVSTDVEVPTIDVGLAFNRAMALAPAMKALKSYFFSAFLSPKLQF